MIAVLMLLFMKAHLTYALGPVFVAATLIVSPLAARLPYLSLEVSANPQFDGLTGLGTSRALSSRPRQAMTLESAMSLAPALPNDRPFRL